MLLVLLLSLAFSVAYGSLSSAIEFVGRFQRGEDDILRSNWPGSGVRFHIQATSSSIKISSSFQEITNSTKFFVGLTVNCEESLPKYEISSAQTGFVHAVDNLVPNKFYTIEIKKLTEASDYDAQGNFVPKDLSIEGGNIVNADLIPHNSCFPKKHQLLFFGDSLTAAYGVDGIPPCAFTASTEDVTHGYASIVAKNLQADAHVVAWSGKGVVRNYGDINPTSEFPLPYYYNRTLATELVDGESSKNYWNPQRYAPAVVVVMLGSNDYSTEPHPSDEQFTTGLINFITVIKKDYPQAKVLAMCAQAPKPNQCENIQAAAVKTQSAFIAIPDSVYIIGGLGCDNHPSVATQKNMADVVTPAVQSLL